MNPPKVALYARVSTGEQTAEPQLLALRELCRRRGWEAVAFVDTGEPGSRSDRPAWRHLRQQLRLGRFDAVAMTKLDRGARSVRQLTDFSAEADALGVRLVVLDQDIDTSTPSGRLLFHVLAAIAEFERDLIRDRTRAGLQAARRRGRRLGRPRALDTVKLARLKRLHAAGRSQRHIARVLGVGHGTVRRELARLEKGET